MDLTLSFVNSNPTSISLVINNDLWNSPCLNWVEDKDGNIDKNIFIGKFENLQEDFNKLLEKCISELLLQNINKEMISHRALKPGIILLYLFPYLLCDAKHHYTKLHPLFRVLKHHQKYPLL